MTESLSQTMHDLDLYEEFSADLDRYIHNATKEISSLFHKDGGDEWRGERAVTMSLQIKEILIEHIYIPIVLGEDEPKGK